MSKRTARLYVRVDPEWLERVKKAAERLGLDLSAYVVLSVSERLQRDEEASQTKK